ncbi:hypothetical protein HRW23_03625 [Streptomyces lunaelactis]|uniref:DUF5949 family protein n=1 Tax=Streptomyces lunaelactis TaxID=1535768 RepID=UPI0015854BFE|nr:DUF5949 family protein [Streptomyces lunaelactis]NUK02970.1 hypothetical protein [Streptomyces lunaelactis]NUK11113.1 hypothetical protein [Streptomyces lunaelactis]NUK18308.1 hypothetical protein [Streptomyces lunaelactis]NUK37182.1 hypothetical protein [Streptomyces lunaelactis]NUK43453.1 hypothetical protein [Streptomyces lunaelactis]
MTSISGAVRAFRPAQLGTLVVIAWSGEHPDDERDMPFLLAYSLGDGDGGPEGVEAAARKLLADIGLPVGTEYVDAAQADGLPVTLLVEAGQAVLTMPHLTAQCTVPPEWLAAVRERGHVYFLFATRAWPQAAPGAPVTEEELRNFAGDEAMLSTAAHCLLPVRQLRG